MTTVTPNNNIVYIHSYNAVFFYILYKSTNMSKYPDFQVQGHSGGLRKHFDIFHLYFDLNNETSFKNVLLQTTSESRMPKRSAQRLR